MNFDYYYGAQAEQFNFIRIPRVMITENTFSDLSLQAKILYSILLDRMTLSRKNSWFDEDNRVFIIYPISDIQSDLGFSRKKSHGVSYRAGSIWTGGKEKTGIWSSQHYICELPDKWATNSTLKT